MTKEKTTLSAEDIAAAIQAVGHSTVFEITSRQIAKAITEKLKSQPVPTQEVARFAEVDLPSLPETAAPRLRPLVKFGRLHFSCPACRRRTVIESFYQGSPVSCPHCFTAIQAPAPKQQIPARNLGRTMEPLLRPQEFAQAVDARRILPWLWQRLPDVRQMVASAGVALLIATLTAIAPIATEWARQDHHISTHPPFEAQAAEPAKDLTAEAEATVRAFLASATPGAMAGLVTDVMETSPRMKDWYQHHPVAGLGKAELGTATHGFYATLGSTVPVSEVPVTFPGCPTRNYVVEHRPEGARIAWEASVGYSPMNWPQILRQPAGSAPVRLRVLACREDYYNLDFASEKDFCCVRLHDTVSGELLGYAYTPRTKATENNLISQLPPPGSLSLQPVQVTVQTTPNSQRTNQVRLIGQVQGGWQEVNAADSPLAMADSKHQ